MDQPHAKTVRITAHFDVPEADAADFMACDLFVTPHAAFEREQLLKNLAAAERGVEGSGDAEAIAAFQWLGGLFARAHVVGHGNHRPRTDQARGYDA